MEKNRSTHFKLAIVCLGILLMASFWLTLRGASDPVSMVVTPEVPREGEPVLATFKLNNPTPEALLTKYQFYANGELVADGETAIAPASYEMHQYAYKNPLQLGDQINFVVRTQSNLGNYEKAISSPSYPPQVWSSFISFASFSTTVMSSMASMTYYQTAFDTTIGFSVGLVTTVVLIILLIFAELTQPVLASATIARLGRVRIRFSTVTWVLFIIFIGITYTNIVMAVST
ncbi:MAG: hypothetical protein ABH839_01710 [Chloroflexota bacterium]